MSAHTPSVTFSFGRNWQSFLTAISHEAIDGARSDLENWLSGRIAGRSVVDVGCGSGIHSLCFHNFGASRLLSLDVDPQSVDATKSLHDTAGRPGSWDVVHGSILDEGLIGRLGKFDIVYSWGVLHHTGDMWRAVAAASQMVDAGGLFMLALYVKGPRYAEDLALKQCYNAASVIVKKTMITQRVAHRMVRLVRQGKNPFRWNARKHRGMDTYHDIVDWLGGLPYEVASRDETVQFLQKRDFVLERVDEYPERWNNIYLFSKK